MKYLDLVRDVSQYNMFKKDVIKVVSLGLLSSLLLVGCGEAKKTADTQSAKTEIVKLDSISTNDFKNHIGDKNYIYVDTRNDSYYNGFREDGEKNGGHIKGAIQYTADWIGKVNKDKLAKFVEDKGIEKDKKIVVYDSNPENVSKVGSMLKKLGYNVFAYDKFGEYANESDAKLEKFKRYDQLLNPKIVKDLIDGKNPETLKNKDYMIFEVSWGPLDKAKDYKDGHIKGSYHFNTDWIENGPDWNISKPDVVKKNLEAAGIDKNKTVILYSNDQSAPFRVMFALKWAGVKDVRVLNGGLYAWKEAGYDLETKVNEPKKVADFGVKIPANPSIDIATPKEAYNMMKKDGLKLISIRSWKEHEGKTSGYDYIPKAGEPKGAVWGFAGSDAGHMQDYYDPDHTLRNPLEMVKLWKEQGIKEHDKGAFYCGTGWRAAVPWEMTQMLGLDSFVVYDGGWNMWQMDNSLPEQKSLSNDVKEPNSKNDWE